MSHPLGILALNVNVDIGVALIGYGAPSGVGAGDLFSVRGYLAKLPVCLG